MLSSYLQSPLPVKLVVKKMSPKDWVVACMVPRGNMVHCLLKEAEGKLVQAKCNISGTAVPDDILDIETEMVEFLESGITAIERDGRI